jgi:hypothetical protein
VTGEVKAGAVVLVAVVAATILWVALGPGPERHGGLTRVEAERRIAALSTDRCRTVRRVECRPATGMWHCSVRMSDGSGGESDVSNEPAVVAFFACG